MTVQEAIAFLTETKLGCKYSGDKQLSDVCDISIKALEKQIPKQLDYEVVGNVHDNTELTAEVLKRRKNNEI